jgi:hypothetical protein
MTKITNTAPGARGVWTPTGLVMVDPGQTVDVEVADGEDLYEGLVAADSEEKALAKMNKDELLALANDAGVTVAKDKAGNDVAVADATKAQLIEAIEAARAS